MRLKRERETGRGNNSRALSSASPALLLAASSFPVPSIAIKPGGIRELWLLDVTTTTTTKTTKYYYSYSHFYDYHDDDDYYCYH